jgi:hypothetical protein
MKSPMPEGAENPMKKLSLWIDSITTRVTSDVLFWARQGLSMGKRALETSAKTLSRTAGSLDQWEKNLERPKSPAKSEGSVAEA